MSGYPNYNFAAFDAARDRLKEMGWEVVSPSDLDRIAGFDGTGPLPESFTYRSRLHVDTNVIYECDAIALLPGWEKSKGARLEVHTGKLIGCSFIDASTGWAYHNNDAFRDAAKQEVSETWQPT